MNIPLLVLSNPVAFIALIAIGHPSQHPILQFIGIVLGLISGWIAYNALVYKEEKLCSICGDTKEGCPEGNNSKWPNIRLSVLGHSDDGAEK